MRKNKTVSINGVVYTDPMWAIEAVWREISAMRIVLESKMFAANLSMPSEPDEDSIVIDSSLACYQRIRDKWFETGENYAWEWRDLWNEKGPLETIWTS